MMEHHELVQEMGSIERMPTQDRLKLARKRRSQQLKKWGQYEKALEKETTKKKKKSDPLQSSTNSRTKRRKAEHIRFVANIALLESAARNDLEEVRRILENDVSPDVTNEDGLTALHQCCIDDNEEMLKLLLEFNANVNACDSEMWTPLHAAATCGHVTLCKHLIDRGAELLAVNADGNMPYDICEDEITLDYIETEMAKRGITQDQIDDTRLTTEKQMLTDLKEFLASGGDLEVKDAVGATLLHIAAANGYLEVGDFLLDNHVNVDARDNESWQPIHAAAYWGQHEMLELLVHNAADLDAKTKNGETAFDLCEDPDMKQKILDMKDEIETNRASRQRPGSARKPKHTHSRNVAVSQESIYSSNSSLNRTSVISTSMRRSSIRGEKSNLSKKEAHEEALHFGLRLLQDDDEIAEVDEEKEHLPATNIDDVTITFDDQEFSKPSDPRSLAHPLANNNNSSPSSYSPPSPNHGGAAARNTIPPSDPKPPPTSILTKSVPKSVSVAAAASAAREYSNGQNYNGRVEEPVDPVKEDLDAHFQNMFLERMANKTRRTNSGRGSSFKQNSQQKFFQPPMMRDKAQNGYNNNNDTSSPATITPSASTSVGPQGSIRDGQLRRFVAPPNSPVVGGEDDDEKKRCCVIL